MPDNDSVSVLMRLRSKINDNRLNIPKDCVYIKKSCNVHASNNMKRRPSQGRGNAMYPGGAEPVSLTNLEGGLCLSTDIIIMMMMMIMIVNFMGSFNGFITHIIFHRVYKRGGRLKLS